MKTTTTKQEFRRTLLPMMELFEHKRNSLSQRQWLDFVKVSEDRILANPEQFLGRDLPDQQSTQETVREIFLEYLKNEIVEAL